LLLVARMVRLSESLLISHIQYGLMNPKCPRCKTILVLVPLGLSKKSWSCPKCDKIYDNPRRVRE
jgi:phage FluMu protein Com